MFWVMDKSLLGLDSVLGFDGNPVPGPRGRISADV